MRTKAVAILVILFTAARPAPAAAWGTEVHKFITARAIALLPAEIRPFFEKYTPTVVEHSIDPDLWRTAGFVEEPPRQSKELGKFFGAANHARLVVRRQPHCLCFIELGILKCRHERGSYTCVSRMARMRSRNMAMPSQNIMPPGRPSS